MNESFYDSRMLAFNAQTSGGLLMAVDADKAESTLAELKVSSVHPRAAVVGEVVPRRDKSGYLVS